MRLEDIREMPTEIEFEGQVYHESIFRSYHVLQKLLAFLDSHPENQFICEVFTDLMNAPSVKNGPRITVTSKGPRISPMVELADKS